MFRIMVN